MHWLSFFIGLLVGWLIEWIIDYFFWRRRSTAGDAQANGLRAKLTDTQAENDQLRGMWQQAQTSKADLATCLDELESQNNEAKQLGDSLSEAQAEIEALREQLVATTAVGVVDDERLSDTAGLETLEPEPAAADSTLEEQGALDLGEAIEHDDLEELDSAVRSAEDSAVRGDELDFGAVVPAVVPSDPVEPDNLKKIEGIGPKIASIFNENGILTFAQLAQTDVDHLKTILENAGPRFRMANPTTWPEQARLAAADEWDNLKVFQDKLKHGRHAG